MRAILLCREQRFVTMVCCSDSNRLRNLPCNHRASERKLARSMGLLVGCKIAEDISQQQMVQLCAIMSFRGGIYAKSSHQSMLEWQDQSILQLANEIRVSKQNGQTKHGFVLLVGFKRKQHNFACREQILHLSSMILRWSSKSSSSWQSSMMQIWFDDTIFWLEFSQNMQMIATCRPLFFRDRNWPTDLPADWTHWLSKN